MPQVVVVGSFVQDLSFSTRRFPAPGETRIGAFRPGPGGKGFNQATACCRLGIDTLFVGAVGDDLFGQQVRQTAAAEGLQTVFQTCPETHTGVASVVVNAEAENLIVVALGANGMLSADEIEADADRFSGGKVLLCQLECNLEATRRALEIGRRLGLINILNPAPINDEVDAEVLALADILTPNETEFAYLQQRFLGRSLGEGYWEDDDAGLASLCARLEVPVVVITLGSEGCFVAINAERAGQRFSLGGPNFMRLPALDVTAVDTTGAGDAFSGGLAAGLCRFGNDLPRALRFASGVAGMSTELPGTSPAMPRLEAVLARFAD